MARDLGSNPGRELYDYTLDYCFLCFTDIHVLSLGNIELTAEKLLNRAWITKIIYNNMKNKQIRFSYIHSDSKKLQKVDLMKLVESFQSHHNIQPRAPKKNNKTRYVTIFW